jgi:O-antigen ligase/polysaccharide polymerase Wzy-like membrane protein
MMTARRPFQVWTWLLLVLLTGYMFLGRPFAYLAIPGTPVYVGELVLVLGVIEVLIAGRALLALVQISATLKLLALFEAWCAFRLLGSIGEHGLDAVRDSALWYYSTFALLVATAAITNDEFVPRLLGWYRRVVPIFLLWAPVAVFLSRVPALDDVHILSDTSINGIKPGDVAVNVALAIVFLWLRLDQVDRGAKLPPWRAALPYVGLGALLVAGSQARSGLLGALLTLAVGLFMLSTGERRRIVLSTVTGLTVIVGIALLLDLRFAFGGEGTREFSVKQVAANVLSVVDSSASTDAGELQGNVNWRRDYWSGVIKDAFSPQYLVTGQGFGSVLAYKYGVEDPDDPTDAPLRSAHNSHLTVLARVGIPGFVLWVAAILAWFRGVGRWIRGRKSQTWAPAARLAAWTAAGALGFMFDAVFDPAMDGPMVGIWVWTLVGLGVAYSDGIRLRRLGMNVRLPLAGGDGRTGAPEQPKEPVTVG